MPVARSAALWGHVLTSLVSNALSVIVIILVALPMGFRAPAGVLAWLSVAGILALFTLALTWIAVIAGLTAENGGRRERFFNAAGVICPSSARRSSPPDRCRDPSARLPKTSR